MWRNRLKPPGLPRSRDDRSHRKAEPPSGLPWRKAVQVGDGRAVNPAGRPEFRTVRREDGSLSKVSHGHLVLRYSGNEETTLTKTSNSERRSRGARPALPGPLRATQRITRDASTGVWTSLCCRRCRSPPQEPGPHCREAVAGGVRSAGPLCTAPPADKSTEPRGTDYGADEVTTP